jgi:hypothetical protein
MARQEYKNNGGFISHRWCNSHLEFRLAFLVAGSPEVTLKSGAKPS